METETQTANAIAYWIDNHFKIYRSEFFSIGGGVTLNKTNGIITLSLFAWLFEIVLWYPTIEIDFEEDPASYNFPADFYPNNEQRINTMKLEIDRLQTLIQKIEHEANHS